ncbi:MAG: DUF1684 domain-containing protein [Saprospiraceae bacterium]|nr:DUF1684 domain-containing protein [Saprospiraceae bacterium]
MRFLLFLCFPAALAAQSADFATELAAHRSTYKKEFLTEERSPLKAAADTLNLDFFPAAPEWVFRARFEVNPTLVPFNMPTYSGHSAQYQHFGTLYFQKDGKEHSLRLYQNLKLINKPGYEDYLFAPFKDHTNGETTYGGGRYMDMRMGNVEVEGKIVYMALDFNRAYNPWCAYSDGYRCPIPPTENHLEFEVPAGEKMFKGERKH